MVKMVEKPKTRKQSGRAAAEDPGRVEDQQPAAAVAEREANWETEAEKPEPRDAGDQSGGQRKLTAADILDPESRYSAERLEGLLGIPVKIMRRAACDGRFLETFGGAESEHVQVSGDRLLRWIEKERIPYKVSELAERVWRVKHPEPEPVKPEPASVSLVDQAAELVDGEQRAIAGWRENMEEHYVALLRRYDSPQERDAAQLAELMRELGIDKTQVERDVEIVRGLAEFESQHARCAEATKQSVDTRAALKQVEERHKREYQEAKRRWRQAVAEAGICREAMYAAYKLKVERPILFAAGGEDEFPKLRTLAPAAD